jgi:hypothetical protein
MKTLLAAMACSLILLGCVTNSDKPSENKKTVLGYAIYVGSSSNTPHIAGMTSIIIGNPGSQNALDGLDPTDYWYDDTATTTIYISDSLYRKYNVGISFQQAFQSKGASGNSINTDTALLLYVDENNCITWDQTKFKNAFPPIDTIPECIPILKKSRRYESFSFNENGLVGYAVDGELTIHVGDTTKPFQCVKRIRNDEGIWTLQDSAYTNFKLDECGSPSDSVTVEFFQENRIIGVTPRGLAFFAFDKGGSKHSDCRYFNILE